MILAGAAALAAAAPTASQPATQPATRPAAETAPASQPAHARSRLPDASAAAAATAPTTAPATAPRPSADPSQSWVELGGYFFLFICFALALNYVYRAARARLLAKDDPARENVPFTLDELRQLRESGAMTNDEYERLRVIVLEREKERLKSPPPPDDKPAQ